MFFGWPPGENAAIVHVYTAKSRADLSINHSIVDYQFVGVVQAGIQEVHCLGKRLWQMGRGKV